MTSAYYVARLISFILHKTPCGGYYHMLSFVDEEIEV
jgi:hypothetical protein